MFKQVKYFRVLKARLGRVGYLKSRLLGTLFRGLDFECWANEEESAPEGHRADLAPTDRSGPATEAAQQGAIGQRKQVLLRMCISGKD